MAARYWWYDKITKWHPYHDEHNSQIVQKAAMGQQTFCIRIGSETYLIDLTQMRQTSSRDSRKYRHIHYGISPPSQASNTQATTFTLNQVVPPVQTQVQQSASLNLPPLCKRAIVTCEYEAQRPDETSLTVGDVYMVEQEFADGWTQGRKYGDTRSYLFPAVCTTIVTPLFNAAAVCDFEAENPDELSLITGEIVTVLLQPEEPDWWLIERGAVCGLVPQDWLEQQDVEMSDREPHQAPYSVTASVPQQPAVSPVSCTTWVPPPQPAAAEPLPIPAVRPLAMAVSPSIPRSSKAISQVGHTQPTVRKAHSKPPRITPAQDRVKNSILDHVRRLGQRCGRAVEKLASTVADVFK